MIHHVARQLEAPHVITLFTTACDLRLVTCLRQVVDSICNSKRLKTTKTNAKQQTTDDNRQPTTDNRQPTTDNRQPINNTLLSKKMEKEVTTFNNNDSIRGAYNVYTFKEPPSRRILWHRDTIKRKWLSCLLTIVVFIYIFICLALIVFKDDIMVFRYKHLNA